MKRELTGLGYDAQMNCAIERLLIPVLLLAAPAFTADKKIVIQASAGQSWVSNDAALALLQEAAVQRPRRHLPGVLRISTKGDGPVNRDERDQLRAPAH